MKFAILGLLVVLVIAFFVMVWKAAKEWRWYQIVAVIFIMLLAVTLVFPTAGVLKSRSAWHQLKEDLEKRAAEVSDEQKVLTYGDPDDPDPQGIAQLTQRLSELDLEAGRRWRNLRKANTPGAITLTKTQDEAVPGLDPLAADPAAAAPAADEPMIPKDFIVYGFRESNVNLTPEMQMLLPTEFLGEFLVTASTPNEVTLTPLPNGLEEQSQRIEKSLSWSLYEMLPLDAHSPFIADGSVRTDDEYFGRVNENLVRGLLGQGATEETIQSYLRDGKRATDDDRPLSRWTMVRFTKDYEIEVDSPDARPALENKDFFDGNGRAITSRLKRGEGGNVKFEVGDQVLIKEEAADTLIADGVAELVDRYYVRPLNDYRFVLRRIRLRIKELKTKIVRLDYEQKELEETIAKTLNMLTSNLMIKLELEQDLAQRQVERAAIQDYTSTLAGKVKKTRDEMVRLHRRNLELEQRLEDYHRQVQQSLDAI